MVTMMNLTEKSAYIKGLTEGLELDKTTKEGKVIAALLELVDELAKIANVTVPGAIEEIRTAEIIHKNECEVAEMKQVVKNFLGI